MHAAPEQDRPQVSSQTEDEDTQRPMLHDESMALGTQALLSVLMTGPVSMELLEAPEASDER